MKLQKVEINPVKLLDRKKRADNERVRYLNQFPPGPTEVDFLKPHQDEESRLRAVINARYALHLPELDIALNTGMRKKEQFHRINWRCVDLSRRDLYVPPSKNEKDRHIRLNAAALAAFQTLKERTGGKDPIFANQKDSTERVGGPRHWFEDAIAQAGIHDFHWNDLRHTFASRLVMEGAKLRTVADLMGHKNIQMTMRYAQLAPEHNLAEVEKLDKYQAASPTGTKTSTGL